MNLISGETKNNLNLLEYDPYVPSTITELNWNNSVDLELKLCFFKGTRFEIRSDLYIKDEIQSKEKLTKRSIDSAMILNSSFD